MPISLGKVLRLLAENKPIILAGLLGQGRLGDWVKSQGSDGLPEATNKILREFEKQFLDCLKEIDTKQGLHGEYSMKNSFHIAFMGVPLPDIQLKQRTRRIDSGMPQPSFIQLPSPVEKALPNLRIKDTPAQKEAYRAMQRLLTSQPDLLTFFQEKLLMLQKTSATYNKQMIAEQEKLLQALTASKTEFLAVKAAGATADEVMEEDEIETQSLPLGDDEVESGEKRKRSESPAGKQPYKLRRTSSARSLAQFRKALSYPQGKLAAENASDEKRSMRKMRSC